MRYNEKRTEASTTRDGSPRKEYLHANIITTRE